MLWERELERLDTHELRVRVNAHAAARGATQPSVVPSDEAAQEQKRREYELEEQYNLVPFRDGVFVSEADFNDGYRRGEALVKTVLRVLERYQEHPQEQLVAYRLSTEQLQDMHSWLKRDRKRQFRELPHPANPTIVEHPVYIQRTQKRQNQQGQTVIQPLPELIGYRLIIGVLATTPVPGDLIVEPQRGKPTFQAPDRPIKACRIPNYVLLAHVA